MGVELDSVAVIVWAIKSGSVAFRAHPPRSIRSVGWLSDLRIAHDDGKGWSFFTLSKRKGLPRRPTTMGCAGTLHSTRIRRSIALRRQSGVSHQSLGSVS